MAVLLLILLSLTIVKRAQNASKTEFPPVVADYFTIGNGDYSIFYPIIYVSITVRQPAHLLTYFLGYFEQIEYPKEHLILHFSIDFHGDYTNKHLNQWISKASAFYYSIDFDDRFDQSAKSKQRALERARNMNIDFILFVGSDVILLEKQMFQKILATGQKVIAPSIKSLDGRLTNYKIAKESQFDLLEEEEENERPGMLVEAVNSAVFVDLKSTARKLTFKPFSSSGAFANSARWAEIPLWILNGEFGFMYDHSIGDDLAKVQYFLSELDLKISALSIPLLYSPYMEPLKGKIDNTGIDKIYYINLARRPDRKLRMDTMLNLFNLTGQKWQAIDGQFIDQAYLELDNITLLEDFRDPHSGRPITKGEIGCFLSHQGIWSDMVINGHQTAIILEDDSRFLANFRPILGAVLADLEQTKLEWDFIFLGRKILDGKVEKPVKGHQYLKTVGYSYWCLAYILKLSGAHKLLKERPWNKLVPVDEYVPIMFDQHPNETLKSYFEERNLKAFTLDPLVVEPNFYIDQSRYVSDTEHSEVF